MLWHRGERPAAVHAYGQRRGKLVALRRRGDSGWSAREPGRGVALAAPDRIGSLGPRRSRARGGASAAATSRRPRPRGRAPRSRELRQPSEEVASVGITRPHPSHTWRSSRSGWPDRLGAAHQSTSAPAPLMPLPMPITRPGRLRTAALRRPPSTARSGSRPGRCCRMWGIQREAVLVEVQGVADGVHLADLVHGLQFEASGIPVEGVHGLLPGGSGDLQAGDQRAMGVVLISLRCPMHSSAVVDVSNGDFEQRRDLISRLHYRGGCHHLVARAFLTARRGRSCTLRGMPGRSQKGSLLGALRGCDSGRVRCAARGLAHPVAKRGFDDIPGQ